MTRHIYKSRSKAAVKVKTPGARVVTHYRNRKRSKPRCAVCGMPLHGIPSSYRPGKLKSKRTVSRYFGGVLCAICLRNKLIKQLVGGVLDV